LLLVSRRGRFRWSIFVVALAASLAWHGAVVVPQIIAKLVMQKPEPQMEVAIVDPDDLTPTPPSEEPPPEKDKHKKPSQETTPKTPKAPEVASVPPSEPKKPEPKPEIAKPVEPPKPQPLPPMDHRKQMVDQDNFPEEQDNAEAKYLAQKNHRAAKETRAEATNLIRSVESQQKTSPSEESQNQLPNVGGKTDKIAELENHQGQKNTMPRSSPMRGDEGQSMEAQKPGPLSMRNLTPRAIDQREAQKTREGVEIQEPGRGDLPMARIGRDGERGQTGDAKKGGRVHLSLDHHNYDNIEGFATAEKERRQAARAEVSHKAGRWDRYQAKAQAMRSSIENFTFDVKPGNQAELGTRASPFAAYITAMHRQIHKLWTFGFLADLDGKPSSNSPYNNEELWTQLEIVIKGDGTVDKVGIVRSSGVLPFDVAAIDSVMTSAPFPPPPQVIKSANGKVYLDWQFHRDERACGTFGVDPHILTTVGDASQHDTSETGAVGKALQKQMEGGRKLQRLGHPEPSHSESRGDERAVEELSPERTTTPPPAETPQVTEEAVRAAEGWFAAYQRGDSAWLAGWSAAPFTAAGEVVAKDGAAVKTMYKQLLAEAPGKHAIDGKVEVLTPAGIRGKLGGLPPGGEEKGMLYAVGRAGGEEFILLLKISNQGWRVSGIDR
jgi:TonB family protein